MANELQARPTGTGLPARWADVDPVGMRASPAFDGSRFVELIKRNALLFLAVLGAVVALGVLLTALQTKTYSAKATVLLDQRHNQVVQGMDDVVSSLPSADSSVVDTEVQLLNSTGMAYRVARAMRLVPDVDPENLSASQQEDVADTLQNFMRHRRVQRVGLTYVMDIAFSATDPFVAQRAANLYAQTYIDSQVDVRVRANARAREHLQQEIAGLQAQVQQADAAVARYKAAHNLNDATANTGTLTEQEISSYNQTLAMARAQAAEDAQRLAAARAQLGRGTDTLGDAASPGLTQLRAQEAGLSTQVADLAARYGPNHPDLIAARGQLADVRKLIAKQSNRTIASLATQAQGSAGRASAVAGKLAATEGALKQAGNAGVALHELESRLEAPQKLLAAYQARLAEISTQTGTEQADARIVSLATLPIKPSSPNWVINMILAVGLGIMAGLLAVIARQLFQVGVSSGEEIETSFGIDFLAALPHVRGNDVAIVDSVVDDPTSLFAESLRTLATSILYGGQTTPRVVAVCSAFADEGKTTTTLAMGRVVALRGRRTLIVDCDVQRPSFDTRFGFGHGVGVIDVLQERATPDQAIVADPRSPAHLLPLGRGLVPGQSLNEAAMADLLNHMRDRYDVVLLDLPPVLQVAEARVFAALADGAVLLARWKRTPRQAIETAIATLLRAQAAVVGLALTRVPASGAMLLRGYAAPVTGRITAG